MIGESIYYMSPTWMQNIAVSAYGFVLYRRRYKGRFAEFLERLKKNESLTRKEIEWLQLTELKRILEHCFEKVPFYKKWARENKLSAKDFNALSDLRKLPIIDKEQIRKDPFQFCSTGDSWKDRKVTISTSGTTGKPLKIYCNAETRQYHYAFWARFQAWHGVLHFMKRATFGGRIIVPPNQTKPPYWRYDKFQNNYLFSSYHLATRNLKYYYDKLVEIRPQQIDGYPSSLFALAYFMKIKKLEPIKPLAVFTSAETLLPHQRNIIEDAFQCKVADQYGCSEMAVFVSQCEKGTYHVHPDYGILEILDNNGDPVPAGKAGEAVCTSFVNMTMPLIRYRLGDIVRLEEYNCKCGRNFPVVSEIIGRIDDILITKDGHPIGRLDPIFKGLSGIKETQIVQTELDTLVLNVVRGEGFDLSVQRALEHELRKRIGDEMKIQFNFVKEISRDRNGKFRSVISLIDPNLFHKVSR